MSNESTALTTTNDNDMLALLGIDTSVQEVDQHLAETVPVQSRRNFKVDMIGKTRMADNRMGQFMPIAPGEQKGKALYDTITVIPMGVIFWGQKSEKVMVEKDGKEVEQMRTVCETIKRPVLDEKGRPITDENGEVIWMKDSKGEDVGYCNDPMFGWKATLERFKFHGSTYGDCSQCAFVKDKKAGIEPEEPCKTKGSMTAMVIRHEGDNVEPHIAEISLNYTTTIRFRKLLDDIAKRKGEFPNNRPTELVLRLALERNEIATNPFYEIDFTAITHTSTIDPKQLAAMKAKAIEKYLADKARIEASRAEAPALPEGNGDSKKKGKAKDADSF